MDLDGEAALWTHWSTQMSKFQVSAVILMLSIFSSWTLKVNTSNKGSLNFYLCEAPPSLQWHHGGVTYWLDCLNTKSKPWFSSSLHLKQSMAVWCSPPPIQSLRLAAGCLNSGGWWCLWCSWRKRSQHRSCVLGGGCIKGFPSYSSLARKSLASSGGCSPLKWRPFGHRAWEMAPLTFRTPTSFSRQFRARGHFWKGSLVIGHLPPNLSLSE